jgi:hypothetical protein
MERIKEKEDRTLEEVRSLMAAIEKDSREKEEYTHFILKRIAEMKKQEQEETQQRDYLSNGLQADRERPTPVEDAEAAQLLRDSQAKLNGLQMGIAKAHEDLAREYGKIRKMRRKFESMSILYLE